MSESTQYESQKQRWFKYGANVVIASVVVIALAGAISYLAARYSRRWDTTRNRVYSLKEQTLNVLKDIKTPIKLVSFYTVDPKKPDSTEQYEAVADLLNEYKQKGNKIDVEMIDPDKELTKVDQFVQLVADKYGSELKKFADVVKQNAVDFEEARKICMAEAARVAELPKDALVGRDLFGQKVDIVVSLGDMLTRLHSKTLSKGVEGIAKLQKEKLPDYRQIKTISETLASTLEGNAGSILNTFDDAKTDKKLDPVIAKYIDEAKPTYEKLKKLGEATTKRLKEAGELKLDEVREKLREKNTILVLGEENMRSLAQADVWQGVSDETRRPSSQQKLRPRFAGEQQVTSAILALTRKTKQKVVFCRVGGPPMATMSMFGPPGLMTFAAAQLEAANFQVLEKDLTGTWAMQAQMQQRPAEPEPSDEEIKDAIWIIIATQAQRNQMGMSDAILPKVQEHISRGGSALFLFDRGAENLNEVLKDFGITVDTDTAILHDVVKSTGAETTDFVESAQYEPNIFVSREYGDHLLTRPLRSLDFIFLQFRLLVSSTAPPDVTVTPLIPAPPNPRPYAKKDLSSKVQSPESLEFEKGVDQTTALYSGAVAEKKSGQRIVVLGNVLFLHPQILTFRDKTGAIRFPGNLELFTNSIYWLAKMEPMLAISPAAMDVSRIGDITDGTLKFWRVGVLLIGLPGCVVLAGVLVYLKRRD